MATAAIDAVGRARRQPSDSLYGMLTDVETHRALLAYLLVLSACTTPSAGPDATPPPADLVQPEPEEEPDLRPPPVTGPDLLSETGLFADIGARRLAPGVLSFAPRWSLWADGAEKERFLLLPNGQQIDTSDMDNWRFPVGTKAWKHFKVGGRLIETRLLWKVRSGDGHRGWWKMAYLWAEDGTDAHAVPMGVTGALGTEHEVPTQKHCDECHLAPRDVLAGVGAMQLSGATGTGMLTELARAGRLSDPPPAEFAPPGPPAVREVLGYLHANCGSSCHNWRHPIPNTRLFQMDLSVKDLAPEMTAVYKTAIRQPLIHVLPDGQRFAVVPGVSEESGLLGRMQLRDRRLWQMPPIASDKVDNAGVAAVKAWIASLPR